jgi:DNA polymerase I
LANIEILEECRERLQKEISQLDAISGSLKVLTNASFGVFGDDDNEALYVRMVAEAITAYGRDCIQKSGDIARNHKATVVYGDTDSLFLRDIDQDVVDVITQEIHDKLNVSMELENEYRYFVLHKKKNYLGVTKDGKLVIKGLLGKKRHVPRFIKKTFSDVLDVLKEVKSKEDFTTGKDKIEDIVKERITALRSKTVPLDDLAFTVLLSRKILQGKGQAYEAARFAASHGLQLSSENRFFSYVLTTGDRSAKPLGLVSQNEVNVNGYLEHMESYIGDQLLDKLGMNFKLIASGGGLEKFITEE